MTDKKLCKHCGMDIAIRNPSGYCDHLYYPENCDVYNEKIQTDKQKLVEILTEFMGWSCGRYSMNKELGLTTQDLEKLSNTADAILQAGFVQKDSEEISPSPFLKRDKELWDLIVNYFPAFEGEIGANNKRELFERISKLIDSRLNIFKSTLLKKVGEMQKPIQHRDKVFMDNVGYNIAIDDVKKLLECSLT